MRRRSVSRLLVLGTLLGLGLGLGACRWVRRTVSGPSVILISIDTLRPDHLDAYGYERETAPRIRRFAADSLVFERAYSQAPKTAPSHMSLLTGVYPDVHGVKNLQEGDNRALSRGVATMAEIFRGAGYRTAAFTGGGQITPTLGFDRGFEVYEESSNAFGRAAWQLKRFAKGVRPFLVFVHTYWVHDPYLPPRRYQVFNDPDYEGEIFDLPADLTVASGKEWEKRHEVYWSRVDRTSQDDVQRLEDLYDGAILQLDEVMGYFFDELESLGLDDETILVLLSDHGEEFFEHQSFLHETLYEEVLRVPLIIRFPGELGERWRGMRVAEVVRLVDVLPTLLEVLELPQPTELQGRSFLPLLTDDPDAPRPVLAHFPRAEERSLLAGDWKLILKSKNSAEELYNLTTDPKESLNLIAEEADTATRLRDTLAQMTEANLSLGDRISSGEPVEISPQLREQLEALGYLGGDN